MRLVAVDVSRRYASGGGVGRISLTIEPNEVVALVGPSGIGKTTLLTIVGGLTRPDTGSVSINGSRASMRRLRSASVWVSQGANSLPSRTVLDNAMIGALADGATRAGAALQARAALEQLGLDHLELSQAQDLSGGELQRLGVARAMCSNRPLVLADEPTGNLDRANTRSVIDAIRLLSTTGRQSALIATHDLDVAAATDRVVSLESVSETRP